MLDQRLDDRRHGEHVRDAVALDELPGRLRVERVAGHQHAERAARDLGQGVDTGAVRERGGDERRVGLGRARHQVAQVVDHDEGHLAVGEHRRLGPAGGARGEEKPQRVVVVDRGRFGGGRRAGNPGRDQILVLDLTRASGADGHDDVDTIVRARDNRVGNVREGGVVEQHARTAGFRNVGDFRRGEAEVGRDPDRAQLERDPHALEHRVGVARVHEDAVAPADAAPAQRRDARVHPCFELGPVPRPLAPDQRGPVREAARGLGQQRAQVHHAARHVTRSRMLT